LSVVASGYFTYTNTDMVILILQNIISCVEFRIRRQTARSPPSDPFQPPQEKG
jgi:hypothetical protein